ncbi:MAG: Ig domain-containing protein, partial [Clostridiales bacterium]|nr:Ig domain-containing protein [Clostridiales bacterium]
MKDLKSSVAKVLAFVFLFTAACGNLSAVAFAGPLPITMSVLGSVPSQVYFGSVMKWKDTYLSLADFEWNSASSTGSVLFAAKNSSLREWDSVYYSGAPGQIAFSDEYVAVVSGDSLIFSSNARDWQQSFLPSAYALIANLYCINSKFIVTAYNNDASKYVCLETADFLEYFEISLPQLTYTEIDARYIQCHDGKLYYIYYEDPLGTSTLSNAKIISSTSLPGAWSEVGSFVRVTGNDYRLHELRWNKDGTPQVYGCYDTAAATPLNSNIKSSNWTDWTNSTPDGTLYPQTSNPYLASDNIESAPKHPVNETVTIRIGNQASFEPYIYWGASLIHPRSATPSPTPPPNTFRAVKYVPYSDFVDSEEVPDGVTRTYSIYTNNFALPDGLFLVPGTGEISGVPLESTSGPRSFSVKIEYEATSDSSLYVVENCNISVGDNLDMAVLLESDPSYEFVTPAATETLPQLAGTIRSIQDHLLVSIGRYPEFDSLYIDGHLQDPASDYTAYEGSTKIVVKAQTIEKYGEGTHTIAAKFLSTDSSTGTSTLKRAALNYHLDLSSPTTSYSPSYTSGSFSAGASLAPLSRTLKASVANKTATAILTARLLKEASVEGDPITVTSPLGDFVVDPVAVKDIGFSTDVVASYTVESLASGSVDISASLSRFGKEIKDFGKGIITISIPYSLPNGVNWTQVAPYHKSS